MFVIHFQLSHLMVGGHLKVDYIATYASVVNVFSIVGMVV